MVTKASKDKKSELDSKVGGGKTNPSLSSTTASAKTNGANEENKETIKEVKPLSKETSKDSNDIGVAKWEEIRSKWTKVSLRFMLNELIFYESFRELEIKKLFQSQSRQLKQAAI